MSKYIDAEKLKEFIDEKWKELADKNVKIGGGKWDAEISTYLSVLRLIDSLQQEQPDKYETALEKAREWMPNVNQGGHAMLIDIFPELGEGLDTRYGGRKQEQPEVDLEKEINSYCGTRDIRPVPDFMDAVARHFAEWGATHLNTRKEK